MDYRDVKLTYSYLHPVTKERIDNDGVYVIGQLNGNRGWIKTTNEIAREIGEEELKKGLYDQITQFDQIVDDIPQRGPGDDVLKDL